MPKINVDWDAVRLDWEAGVLSDRAIGKNHGVSHVSIGKRAKSENWQRSLKDKIRALAEAKVTNAAVTSQVTSKQRGNPIAEAKVVEANAALQAGIQLAHRSDVQRAREICQGLIEELAEQAMGEMELKMLAVAIASLMDNPKEAAKSVELVMRSLGLGSRADIMRKLAGSLDALVKLERLVFNISDRDENPNDSYEARLSRLAE